MNVMDMIIVVLLLFSSTAPIIVYLDATKNKIGSPGSWAIFVLVIWIIGIPVYLFKRKGLIAKAKETPVEEERRALTIVALALICILFFCFSFYMSFKDEISAASNTQQSTATAKTENFNTTDKSVSLNGNFAIAISKINKMGIHSIGDIAAQTTAEAVTKSPYSALGKPFKITGKIYKVEELPPGDHDGHWMEILLLTENPNSPLGITTVDFLYNGDVSKIKSGQIVTCSGYFVGSYEAPNSVGGKVEAVAFVGNELRLK